MLTIILRRGGAWRFAALVVLAASILSFGITPDRAEAHVGTPGTLCGSQNLIAATYLGQTDIWDDSSGYWIHFHIWLFPMEQLPTYVQCGILW